jgi:outer membrane protein TolC
MNRLITLIFLFLSFGLHAQGTDNLTLEILQQDAVKNYPLLKQTGLLDASNNLAIKNMNTAWLPQLQINGQATYQSAVPSIPIDIPHIKIPTLDKDHYQLTLDGQQTIYDGGMIGQQKEIQQINNEVSKQQVEVELFKLKDRVNQLYFSVLMSDQNDSQLQVMARDINANLKTTESGIKNGMLLATNADILKAALINIDEKRIENRYMKKAALDMLSILTGRALPENTFLKQPDYPLPSTADTSSLRPELSLYTMQQKVLYSQQNFIKTKELPKLSAFGQAGFGKPGLDFFSNDFKPFYIVGAKASWNLSAFYSTKREMEIQKVSADIISQQKLTFDKNTMIQLKQQMDDIEKIKALITKDEELIVLRKRITINTSSQVENGVITATEYIIALDSESQAELNLRTHSLQMQLAITNYRNILGK